MNDFLWMALQEFEAEGFISILHDENGKSYAIKILNRDALKKHISNQTSAMQEECKHIGF